MAKSSPPTETEIMADIISPQQGDLSVEVAESVLAWKFTRRAISRMNQLAERNRKATITPAERQELERYLRVGSLVNLLQAKARLSLKSVSAADS
jgi:hypothetical protein